MNALYFCQEWSGLLLTALASFATVMQMSATLLVLEQRPLTSQRVARDILEGACFAQLFVLAWVIAQFQGSMGGGFVPDNRCEGLRTGIFGLVCITALICAACFQMRCAVLPMTMGLLTIPRAEALFGKMFPTVLGIALLFWLVRATALCVRRLRERKNGFSVRSVKEAMDSLPDGLLFYAADGYIILVNQRMQQLLETMLEKVPRDGRQIDRALQSGVVRAVREHEDVYRLPDGMVWQFARTPLVAGRHCYTQLSAADITRQWQITEMLHCENALLEDRGNQLRREIENMETLTRQQAAIQMRVHLHDALGQQMAVLLKMLRGQADLDGAEVKAMVKQLPRILYAPNTKESSQQLLARLRNVMQGVGVVFTWEGPFPKEEQAAQLCARICMEAATNAVRHGFAAHVHAVYAKEGTEWCLTVTNDGIPPAGPVREGGGLTQIRTEVEKAGGCFLIQPAPSFCLHVKLPGGDTK